MPRWQPPHPDPLKVEATPISQRRKQAERQPAPCSWSGCRKISAYGLFVPICEAHAELVTKAVSQRQERRDERLNETVTRVRQDAQTTVREIETGQPITHPEYIPGWVYYLEIDGIIKIGYASDVTDRMRAYPPTAKLLAVEPGTRTLEAERHGLFNAYLAHGREWFRDVPELRNWIASLVAQHGDARRLAYRYTTPRDGRQTVYPRSYRGARR